MKESGRAAQEQARAEKLKRYVEENYDRHLELEELAEHFSLTYSYLSRCFKKTTGMNFIAYLNEVRLDHAARELSGTGEAVTKISEDCGFVNPSAMNKAFRKKFGMSPTEYRKTNAVSGKRTSLISREAFADLNSGSTYKKNWAETVNAGSAADLLNAKLQKHILMLRDEAGFRYIRIWNIFSWQMEIRQGHRTDRLNFFRVDEVLDFLVSNGLKPFIDFGDKPDEIRTTSVDYVKREEGDPIFRSMEESAAMVQAFFRHIIQRYGSAEAASWRYEIWIDNRTDRQTGSSFVSYPEIFRKNGDIMRKALPGIMLGGCGMMLGDERLPEHIGNWAAQSSGPDFLSVYAYPYMVEDGKNGEILYIRRAEDPDFLKHRLEYMKTEMRKAGIDCPVYVTEWNVTVSSRNFYNDSCAKGCYIIRNLIGSIGEADTIAYWSGSDLLGMYYDSGAILNGCPGLITGDGILKPAFYAFRFLHALGGRLIAAGENYCVTENGPDEYTILCFYYCPHEEEFGAGAENQVSPENVRTLSAKNPPLALHLELKNAGNGEWNIKRSLVSPEKGSALDAWARLGYSSELSRDEMEYIQRVSTPEISISRTVTVNHAVVLDETLQPDAFMLIRLTRTLQAEGRRGAEYITGGKT